MGSIAMFKNIRMSLFDMDNYNDNKESIDRLIVERYKGRPVHIFTKNKEYIDFSELYISPIVELELQYLFESEKSKIPSKKIIQTLQQEINLKICNQDFLEVIQEALKHNWTRDPFDRIITAHASLHRNVLLTRDQNIHEHYKYAVWD